MNETPRETEPGARPSPPADRKPQGYLDVDKVRAVGFYLVTLCIVVSVVACILAIWDFADEDTLWRTVATCVVIAAGMGLFSVVNAVFGSDPDR